MTDYKLHLIYLFTILEFIFTFAVAYFLMRKIDVNDHSQEVEKLGLFLIWCFQIIPFCIGMGRILA